MIRQPLALRIPGDPARSPRDQIRRAATIGARGVVLDANGDLGPDRLGETGRRELRHLLRSTELTLVALGLPTRRPFDTLDQLDDRLARADRAFALAYDLGTRLVVVRAGAVPGDGEADAARRSAFDQAIGELGRRADRRGVVLALETGLESGAAMAAAIDALALPTLAASLDPAALLAHGHDPVAAAVALGQRMAHAYAADAAGMGPRRASAADPRGFGFAPGVMDWEAYLGALEEVDYRGYLTVWPDPGADSSAAFGAIRDRLAKF